jgi:hypothetical protein
MDRSDNYHKFIKFRNQYKRFVYESFDFKRTSEELSISFDFNLDNKFFFRPSIQIPLKSFTIIDNLSDDKLRNFVFHIGMVELISYWKAACPKEIVIKPYHLNEDQKQWWKHLYYNGLGEFFYLNSIQTSIDDFVHLNSESQENLQSESLKLDDSVIIPVGGGKDSAVTIELLSEENDRNLLLILNPRKACTDTAAVAGFSEDRTIIVNRTIDPLLLKLNDEGYLNGHTPFSALLAFVSILCAAITGRKHIALSNESSANESTVEGSSVNHQYSKSFEFEKDFREYYVKYISADINYFSFLRPVSELQIARLFSENEKYFPVFKSCNAGSKTDIWCCHCSKCLFTYIILSPFIAKEKMLAIYGKDLLNDKSLMHEFNQLIGVAKTKPFECVGTIDEVNASLCELIKREKGKLPELLEYYKSLDCYCSNKNLNFTSLLKEFNKEHYLNQKFTNILLQHLND